MRKTLAILISVAFLLTAAPASASPKTVKGKSGQVLRVDKTTIKPNGVVTVTGKNFDPAIGIYVAFCKVPKKGQLPTPCGGGINTAGEAISSVWISNNPPAYGDGLVQQFGKNGSFKLKLRLQPMIETVDCRKTKCAITVRADHTRSSDRSLDLFVPIKFIK